MASTSELSKYLEIGPGDKLSLKKHISQWPGSLRKLYEAPLNILLSHTEEVWKAGGELVGLCVDQNCSYKGEGARELPTCTFYGGGLCAAAQHDVSNDTLSRFYGVTVRTLERKRVDAMKKLFSPRSIGSVPLILVNGRSEIKRSRRPGEIIGWRSKPWRANTRPALLCRVAKGTSMEHPMARWVYILLGFLATLGSVRGADLSQADVDPRLCGFLGTDRVSKLMVMSGANGHDLIDNEYFVSFLARQIQTNLPDIANAMEVSYLSGDPLFFTVLGRLFSLQDTRDSALAADLERLDTGDPQVLADLLNKAVNDRTSLNDLSSYLLHAPETQGRLCAAIGQVDRTGKGPAFSQFARRLGLGGGDDSVGKLRDLLRARFDVVLQSESLRTLLFTQKTGLCFYDWFWNQWDSSVGRDPAVLSEFKSRSTAMLICTHSFNVRLPIACIKVVISSPRAIYPPPRLPGRVTNGSL